MRNYQYNNLAVEQFNSKKSQALLFVFFLLLIVGILAGALAVMWQAEIEIRGAEKEGLVAFYLAQAGIENAKIYARHNPSSFPYQSGWINFSGGRYNFTIAQVGPGPNRRNLSSTGQALDSSGNPIAERQLGVEVQGIGTPSTADDQQLPWAWHEE